MCGFAGYKTDSFIDPATLKSMIASIEHRGPDDQGIWVSSDKRIGIGACRLSIQDTSHAGAQPMQDNEHMITIALNGELYNSAYLRNELASYGYQFKSQSDTELFLYAYKKWGISFLEKLDGMFAAAIYDMRSQELLLIRDRMGVKPLYFSTQANKISFASEIKALWCLPWMVKSLNMQAVSHYLTFLASPAPMTMFEKVYKLPAGYYMRIDAQGTFDFVQWYSPLKNSNQVYPKKESGYAKSIIDLIRTSIHKRLVADVPVGALLSGGLDSSLIVALMKEQQDQVKTFNISFADDPEREERSWARRVAKKFGTDHYELILSEQEAFSFYQKMIYHQDEPLGDSVCMPLYFVSKLARDAGVKVVLSGEGSDELFCGYPLYAEYLKLQPWWNVTQHYTPSVIKQGLFYAARPLYANKNRLDLLYSWAQNRSLFWGGVRLFSPLWKEEVVQSSIEQSDPIVQAMIPGFPQADDSYAIIDYYKNQFYREYPKGDFMAMITYIELKHRLPELILTRTDKMSMAASIEARVPFLDNALVEYMLGVPMRLKYARNQTKYILKKAAEGILPHDIIYREKMGFVSPVTRWFQQGRYFKEHLQDQLVSSSWRHLLNGAEISRLIQKNKSSSYDYSYQLWGLCNLMGLEL